MTQVCKNCGSEEVARCKWVNVNTDEIYSSADSGTSLEWCFGECNEQTEIVDTPPDSINALTGSEAETMLNRLLKGSCSGASVRVCGYYRDEEHDVWIAFDNRTNNCNTEEFSTELKCKLWLTYP